MSAVLNHELTNGMRNPKDVYCLVGGREGNLARCKSPHNLGHNFTHQHDYVPNILKRDCITTFMTSCNQVNVNVCVFSRKVRIILLKKALKAGTGSTHVCPLRKHCTH